MQVESHVCSLLDYGGRVAVPNSAIDPTGDAGQLG